MFYQVEYPDGKSTLCIMPAKFNKKLWVCRGGFVVIEESKEAQDDRNSRITGTIATVLYGDHIKVLRKMQGVWPVEFEAGVRSTASDQGLKDTHTALPVEDFGGEIASGSSKAVASQENDGNSSSGSSSSGDDSSLPPLHQNNNRKVIYHAVSDTDSDDD